MSYAHPFPWSTDSGGNIPQLDRRRTTNGNANCHLRPFSHIRSQKMTVGGWENGGGEDGRRVDNTYPRKKTPILLLDRSRFFRTVFKQTSKMSFSNTHIDFWRAESENILLHRSHCIASFSFPPKQAPVYCPSHLPGLSLGQV